MVSYSVDYNQMWEEFLLSDGNTLQIYGNEFNPNRPANLTSERDTLVYNATTSFNLWWFQPGNEVCAFGYRLLRDWYWPTSSKTQNITQELLRSSDWSSWSAGWTLSESFYRSSISYEEDWEQWINHWVYFWVDKDEIRTNYTYYKFHVTSSDWLYDFFSPTITTSNLTFDTSLHDAGFMWVEWAFLCYIDNTWWEAGNTNKWYKHLILYDTWYDWWYVGTWYAGSIWMETDVVRRIYYVDENWVKRRTHEAQNRFGYPNWQWSYVGTGYKWCIWISWNYDDAANWYWYLCFVNNSWYKMRLWNWVLY